jgi:hypothetical protein
MAKFTDFAFFQLGGGSSVVGLNVIVSLGS